jgi:GT2 family glycosyltransferase
VTPPPQNVPPDAPLSIIVISRHRTELLLRAVVAIGQQDHPRIELIIVADPDAARAVLALGLPIKIVTHDEPGVGAARNLGLAQAAAPIVAFLDDDAVPEPTWARRIVGPFSDPRVVAATGFVRGRNGITFQWQANLVGDTGFDQPLEVAINAVSLHRPQARRVVKTQGTNCAFRRDDLLAIGGFDPAYRFYLDEADVDFRLGAAGGLTAVVPMAQVHHGFAPSDKRRGDRVPLTLHDIGASTMVFLRRHADPKFWTQALGRLRRDQRARLIRHMVRGGLEPRDVGRLMATLNSGIAAGAGADLRDLPPIPPSADAFLLLPGTGPRPGKVIAGRKGRKDALRRTAQKAVADGFLTTLMIFGFSLRPHWHRFDIAGYWVQEGGLFGRSDRAKAWLSLLSPRQRKLAETRRIAALRPVRARS